MASDFAQAREIVDAEQPHTAPGPDRFDDASRRQATKGRFRTTEEAGRRRDRLKFAVAVEGCCLLHVRRVGHDSKSRHGFASRRAFEISATALNVLNCQND
jgi:hypothetical protein